MVCRNTSEYMDSRFIPIREEVDYERRLSVLVDRSCRLLGTKVLKTAGVALFIDPRFTDFSIDGAWFIRSAQYWSGDLHFEVHVP